VPVLLFALKPALSRALMSLIALMALIALIAFFSIFSFSLFRRAADLIRGVFGVNFFDFGGMLASIFSSIFSSGFSSDFVSACSDCDFAGSGVVVVVVVVDFVVEAVVVVVVVVVVLVDIVVGASVVDGNVGGRGTQTLLCSSPLLDSIGV